MHVVGVTAPTVPPISYAYIVHVGLAHVRYMWHQGFQIALLPTLQARNIWSHCMHVRQKLLKVSVTDITFVSWKTWHILSMCTCMHIPAWVTIHSRHKRASITDYTTHLVTKTSSHHPIQNVYIPAKDSVMYMYMQRLPVRHVNYIYLLQRVLFSLKYTHPFIPQYMLAVIR